VFVCAGIPLRADAGTVLIDRALEKNQPARIVENQSAIALAEGRVAGRAARPRLNNICLKYLIRDQVRGTVPVLRAFVRSRELERDLEAVTLNPQGRAGLVRDFLP
jgi:hypothetical protein